MRTGAVVSDALQSVVEDDVGVLDEELGDDGLHADALQHRRAQRCLRVTVELLRPADNSQQMTSQCEKLPTAAWLS